MNRRNHLIGLSVTFAVAGASVIILLVTETKYAYPETSRQTAMQEQDPELNALVAKLRNPSGEDASAAFGALVEKQAAAVPVLQASLSDPETRWAAVEILTSISPQDSIPVLIKALEAAPEANSLDEYFKTYIIGGLGRLKAQEAVPILEALYKEQENAKGLMAISIAWALKEITGKEYGPAFDPWMQGK